MRTIKLFNLAKGIPFFICSCSIITTIHQYTYSNIPLFTQYLIKTLLLQPGVADGSISVGEVNLPSFSIILFSKKMQFVLNISIKNCHSTSLITSI